MRKKVLMLILFSLILQKDSRANIPIDLCLTAGPALCAVGQVGARSSSIWEFGTLMGYSGSLISAVLLGINIIDLMYLSSVKTKLLKEIEMIDKDGIGIDLFRGKKEILDLKKQLNENSIKIKERTSYLIISIVLSAVCILVTTIMKYKQDLLVEKRKNEILSENEDFKKGLEALKDYLKDDLEAYKRKSREIRGKDYRSKHMRNDFAQDMNELEDMELQILSKIDKLREWTVKGKKVSLLDKIRTDIHKFNAYKSNMVGMQIIGSGRRLNK